MKLALALAALIALATSASAEWRRELAPGTSDAGPKDMLVVVLEESNGEKSIHQQMLVHERCSQFVKEYRQITGAGGTVTLTFESPPKVTGKVLSASCIRPDGTIEGDGSDMGGRRS